MSKLELFDTDYTREETIQSISDSFNEPSWLKDRRLKAYRTYTELPFDKDTLFYKYTTFRNFNPQTLVPSWNAESIELVNNGVASEFEPHLIETQDGISSKLPQKLIESGVIFDSLHNLLESNPSLAEKIVSDASFSLDFDKLGALSIAFASNITILYIPKDLKVEEPLVKYTYLANGSTANFSEFIAYFEEGSEVNYINVLQTNPAQKPQDQLYSAMETIIAKDNSNIKALQIQNWNQKVLHLVSKLSKLSPYARYRSLTMLQGADMSRHNSQLDLDGNGSEGYDLFAAFGKEKQRFDVKSELHHNGKDTIGQTHSRQVMMDKSESILRGLIVITEDGVNADSWLTSQGMTLDKGKVTAIPALRIDQNEVKAAHAASVEPLNEDLIFYLQTRGIDRDTSKEMLIKGYFEYVFKILENEHSIELSRTYLNEKWKQV